MTSVAVSSLIADHAEALRQELEYAVGRRRMFERLVEAERAVETGMYEALVALGEDPQVPSRASVESDRPRPVDEDVVAEPATREGAAGMDAGHSSATTTITRRPGPVKRSGPPPRVDHAEVAHVAREAFRAGKPLSHVVAEHFGISRGAAEQRIVKARAAGHDVPTPSRSDVMRAVHRGRRPAGTSPGTPVSVEEAAAMIGGPA